MSPWEKSCLPMFAGTPPGCGELCFMIDWTTIYALAAHAEPHAHAREAFRDLVELVSHLPESWGGRMAAAELATGENGVLAVLQDEPGLSQLVKNFHEHTLQHLRAEVDWADPIVSANLASVFSTLLGDYEDHGSSTELRASTAQIVDAAVDALLRAASGQVDTLVRVTREVLDVVRRFRMDKRRLILVELPVGNSIPVKLLSALLISNGFATETVRVSLSRSDAGRARARVRELLEHCLGGVLALPDDVIIYVDEWNTGSNFNKICKRLERIAAAREPPGYLLPVGLLAADATNAEHFGQFAKDHDARLQRLGLQGKAMRFALPELKSRFKLPTPFFWGERDRLAGYRKMQLWGAIFSSLDEALKALSESPETLDRARDMCLATVAKDGAAVSDKVARDRYTFSQMFRESYTDYLEIRPTLAGLDDDSHERVAEGVEQPVHALVAKMLEIVNSRKAKLAVTTASVYQRLSHQIEPADRYYYDDHAPAVANLQGGYARAHVRLLEALVNAASVTS